MNWLMDFILGLVICIGILKLFSWIFFTPRKKR